MIAAARLAFCGSLSSPGLQDYPSNSIQIVVPNAAGGSTDVFMRLLQPHIETAIGGTLVVITVPGSGSAEHWDHLRSSSPIEIVFATIRRRTVRTKGALSQKTAKLMVLTVIQAATKSWRRLNGSNQLPKVIEGIKFRNDVEVTGTSRTSAT